MLGAQFYSNSFLVVMSKCLFWGTSTSQGRDTGGKVCVWICEAPPGQRLLMVASERGLSLSDACTLGFLNNTFGLQTVWPETPVFPTLVLILFILILKTVSLWINNVYFGYCCRQYMLNRLVICIFCYHIYQCNIQRNERRLTMEQNWF